MTVQTAHLVDDDVLRRLAAVPGDRLVVEPISRTREALAPQVRRDGGGQRRAAHRIAICGRPTRAGDVQFGASDTFEASGDVPVIDVLRGRGGALHRRGPHRDGRRQRGLHDQRRPVEAGQRRVGDEPGRGKPRVIWYAPQHTEGESSGAATNFPISFPISVTWMFWQLCLGRAAARAVEGPADRSACRRAPPGCGAGIGNRRGPRAALPVAAGRRPRRGCAAHRDPAAAHCPGSGSGPNADRDRHRRGHRAAKRPGSKARCRTYCSVRPRPPTRAGKPCQRARQHRKAGRTVVTQPVAQTAPSASRSRTGGDIGLSAQRVAGACGTRSPRWSSARTPSSAAW